MSYSIIPECLSWFERCHNPNLIFHQQSYARSEENPATLTLHTIIVNCDLATNSNALPLFWHTLVCKL